MTSIRCPVPSLTIKVDGYPVPWARSASGQGRRRFTPPKQKAYIEEWKEEAEKAMEAAGLDMASEEAALVLVVNVVYPLPKKISKKELQRRAGDAHLADPDWDNLSKIVSDALQGIVYANDNHIYSSLVVKRWAKDQDDEGGVSATVTWEEPC